MTNPMVMILIVKAENLGMAVYTAIKRLPEIEVISCGDGGSRYQHLIRANIGDWDRARMVDWFGDTGTLAGPDGGYAFGTLLYWGEPANIPSTLNIT